MATKKGMNIFLYNGLFGLFEAIESKLLVRLGNLKKIVKFLSISFLNKTNPLCLNIQRWIENLGFEFAGLTGLSFPLPRQPPSTIFGFS